MFQGRVVKVNKEVLILILFGCNVFSMESSYFERLGNGVRVPFFLLEQAKREYFFANPVGFRARAAKMVAAIREGERIRAEQFREKKEKSKQAIKEYKERISREAAIAREKQEKKDGNLWSELSEWC